MKCDETKPSCRRCIAYGQQCEGYQIPKTWLFQPSTNRPHSLVEPLPLVRSVGGTNRHPSEARALQYFNEKTAPLLSTFNSVAFELWNFVIPQIGNSEEPLRHLMIAAASRHEALHNSPQELPLPAPCSLATVHHAKAIRMLASSIHQVSPEVMLMCCLLFISCENLQASPSKSLPHLQAGLKILREWESGVIPAQRSSLFATEIVRRFIEPTFARLEAAAIFSGQVSAPPLEEAYDLVWSEPRLPDAFLDPFVMRESFHDLCQWVYCQSKQHKSFWASESPALGDVKALFSRWHRLAWQYVRKDKSNKQIMDPDEVLAFDAHYQMVWLLLNCASSPQEMIYDQFVPKMRDVLRTCYILDARTAKTAGSHMLSQSPGLLPPVFVIALACREPDVRKGAIRLLQRMHANRHGLEDECSAGRLAETVMELEEMGLPVVRHCHEIPESHRIRPLMMDLTQSEKVILTYARSPYKDVHRTSIPLRARNVPSMKAKLWPPSELVRVGGYQGLIRLSTWTCLCKAYGTV